MMSLTDQTPQAPGVSHSVSGKPSMACRTVSCPYFKMSDAFMRCSSTLSIYLVRWFAVEVPTLEVKTDVGFISDDPRIVSWWEKLCVTRTYFALCSIIHPYMQASRNAVVEMRHLATVSTSRWFHMLRPSPSRLKS